MKDKSSKSKVIDKLKFTPTLKNSLEIHLLNRTEQQVKDCREFARLTKRYATMLDEMLFVTYELFEDIRIALASAEELEPAIENEMRTLRRAFVEFSDAMQEIGPSSHILTVLDRIAVLDCLRVRTDRLLSVLEENA